MFKIIYYLVQTIGQYEYYFDNLKISENLISSTSVRFPMK